MEGQNQRLTCERVKQWNMVDYLSRLGYQPVRLRNVNAWYHSPLRNEKTPSFKINRRLNRWYDFGLGKGGNLIDFGVLYHRCTVKELLQILSGDTSFQSHSAALWQQEVQDKGIVILEKLPLHSQALLRYLEARKIPLQIAASYCEEIRYRARDKEYIAIGFKNNSGGYELRSPFFKGSSSPKGITFIDNGGSHVSVFEGFFDFLSHRTFYNELDCPQTNHIILNSLSFFEKAQSIMARFQNKLLFLDRDISGQNCSLCAQAISKNYMDMSSLYKGYKDLNNWLVNGNPYSRQK